MVNVPIISPSSARYNEQIISHGRFIIHSHTDANVTHNAEQVIVLHKQAHFDEAQCRSGHDCAEITLLSYH